MAIVTTEAVVLQTLDKMLKRLERDQGAMQHYQSYYDGVHNLRFATRKYRESFGALFKEFSDNWMAVVVDAAVERMKIEGFRFPVGEGESTGESEETTGDSIAWDIWQRNNLDRASELAHEQMFVSGRVYLSIGPQEDGTTFNPVIQVEHPSEVYVHHQGNSLSPRVAAVKRWYDHDEQLMYATLYLPDSIWKFQAASKSDRASVDVKWVEREVPDGQKAALENPIGVVPVIPIYNRQQLLGHGKSEIVEVIPLQNALNKFWNDMLVSSEFNSFRQRVFIGMQTPEDENGNPLPDFDLKAAVNRIINIKDPGVKVQEFQVSDMSGMMAAIVACRDHIAARTRTPPHYLVGSVVNVSGEALKASEAGLVMKVKRRSRFAGEDWEEAERLAMAFKALEAPADEKKAIEARANCYAAETIWSNPEIQTESQLADSLAKFATLGVPRVPIWERMGATQTEITRWQALLKEEPAELPPQALAALLRASASEGL
jgi:hypothetical protein